MNEYEEMLDAQAGCVPCKLCGGKAVISDAGPGAGYYIRCSNAETFRPANGCLITERRLGGVAYNVKDWWNRLHATPPPPSQHREPIEADREAITQALREIPDEVFRRIAESKDVGTCRNRVADLITAHRLAFSTPAASDAEGWKAETILRRFVISLTSGGRNRETQLSINHDELRALLREAQALLDKEATDGE